MPLRQCTTRCLFVRLLGLASISLVLLFGGCSEEVPPPAEARLALGEKVFKVYCHACHQLDGKGVANGPPPLADSPWLRGSRERLVRIMLHGFRSPREAQAGAKNVDMIGFQSMLGDEQIAAVLTYARSQFAGMDQPISATTVKRIRQAEKRDEFWTVNELLEIP